MKPAKVSIVLRLDGADEVMPYSQVDIPIQEELTIEFLKVIADMVATFDRKQHDYGSGNIAKFGELGTLVRASDKLERLVNLRKNGKQAANESIDDSWLDLATYGVIALMCRKGVWPGVPGAT